jgi:hypothetical protein
LTRRQEAFDDLALGALKQCVNFDGIEPDFAWIFGNQICARHAI